MECARTVAPASGTRKVGFARHYLNMTSRQYTKVACGFAVLSNGTVWAVQDFQ